MFYSADVKFRRFNLNPSEYSDRHYFVKFSDKNIFKYFYDDQIGWIEWTQKTHQFTATKHTTGLQTYLFVPHRLIFLHGRSRNTRGLLQPIIPENDKPDRRQQYHHGDNHGTDNKSNILEPCPFVELWLAKRRRSVVAMVPRVYPLALVPLRRIFLWIVEGGLIRTVFRLFRWIVRCRLCKRQLIKISAGNLTSYNEAAWFAVHTLYNRVLGY